jgi:hypothetical protein
LPPGKELANSVRRGEGADEERKFAELRGGEGTGTKEMRRTKGQFRYWNRWVIHRTHKTGMALPLKIYLIFTFPAHWTEG